MLHVLPTDIQIRTGESINLAVMLENVASLHAIEVRMTFDPTVLQVVDADPTQPAVQVGLGQLPMPDLVEGNAADNNAGSIWYKVAHASSREAASGSGLVMTVRFRGERPGISPIAITTARGVDRQGEALVMHAGSGRVIVVADHPGGLADDPYPLPIDQPPPPTLPSSDAGYPLPSPALPSLDAGYPLPSPSPAALSPTPISMPEAAYPLSASPTLLPAQPTASPTTTRPPTPMPSAPTPLTAPTEMRPEIAAALDIPTVPIPASAPSLREQPMPLVSREVFICQAVFLALFTAALWLYLARGSRQAARRK